ncbi:MAG: nitrile hydratase accessory protein [Acidimicrobiales bacterium]
MIDEGPGAVPRRNGELAFDAPWQTRIFGLAAAVVETRFDGDREPFRQCLIDAIASDPDRPYWESWEAALETLVIQAGIIDRRAI